MFFNELFEGVNPNQGVATYQQLLLAVKEGRETEIDGMKIDESQAKYLLKTFKKIVSKEGKEPALEFLGDYGQIGYTLNKHAVEQAKQEEYRSHQAVHESQQIDEISDKTIDSYYDKVLKRQKEHEGGKFSPHGSFERLPAKRQRGIDRATKRILRPEWDPTDHNEIDEGRDGAYDERNPKIDLFHKDTKQYLGSTNWYSSLKSAVSGFEEKKPELKGKVIAHISHKELEEGAVDQLEQRRIDDLNNKMDSAKADASRALKKGDKQSAEHCMRMFNKYKEERDSYYKINIKSYDDQLSLSESVDKLKDRIRQYEKMMWDNRIDDANKKIIRQKINQAKSELAKISESKKKVTTLPKPRDPNWKTLAAKGASGASGAHDKGYTRKEKHKNRDTITDELSEAQQKKSIKKSKPSGNARSWIATIRLRQSGYVGNAEAQAWAPNMAVARQMIQAQYGIPNSDIINIKEVKIVYEDESRLERRYQESGITTGNAYNAESAEMAEGWSDAIVSQRTGTPRTPYSVYIKGKKWKDFENDDHAEAVANKLRAKFKADGRDPETITVAPTDMSEASMNQAASNPSGPKFSGYYGATQKGAPRPGQSFGAESAENDDEMIRESEIKAIEENLKKWFKEKWVRFGPDGKIKGDCARGSSSEGKPKCLPQSKAHALGKKGRASAAAKKRREDPNPERKGKAKNVATKVKEQGVSEAVSKKDLLKQVGDKLNDPEFRKQPADPTKHWERGDHWKGAGPGDYGYTGYQGHGMPTDRAERARIRAEKKKGVAETVTDVRSGMAEIYHRLAPKIEHNRDSFLAGQLYDELENYAELHGAEDEFKRMMNGARNRAHMEYDTNPGGFHNWFWFLPFENVSEGSDTSGYKEIEFVCSNPNFLDATDPELQKQMYVGLKRIPNVIPLMQDQGDYSEGQCSLTAIYKDHSVRGQILKLAKQLGIQVDLEQTVSDDYVDRAIRGEHEGQQYVSEEQLDEKQDACYRKVKSRYKVWPSAYASGALVQCRKVGAKNWGTGGKKK